MIVSKMPIRFILVNVIIASMLLSASCDRPTSTNMKSLEPGVGHEIPSDPNFRMNDTLSCTVALSSNPERVGNTFQLTHLYDDNPIILFDDLGTSPFVRVHESDDTYVMLLVASFKGGIDAVTLSKKTGVFGRISSAHLVGAVIHTTASKGTCK